MAHTWWVEDDSMARLAKSSSANTAHAWANTCPVGTRTGKSTFADERDREHVVHVRDCLVQLRPAASVLPPMISRSRPPS